MTLQSGRREKRREYVNLHKQDEDAIRATISMFFGIIIRMNKEDRAPHHKPHIYGWHAGKSASFDIETGERLAGNMDADDETMIRAWVTIHREELFADWELLNSEGTFFKIDPLR